MTDVDILCSFVSSRKTTVTVWSGPEGTQVDTWADYLSNLTETRGKLNCGVSDTLRDPRTDQPLLFKKVPSWTRGVEIVSGVSCYPDSKSNDYTYLCLRWTVLDLVTVIVVSFAPHLYGNRTGPSRSPTYSHTWTGRDWDDKHWVI